KIFQVDATAAMGTLAELAATYDGTDRYQLEAINVAAGEHKAELYSKLQQAGPWSAEKLPLMAVLDPKAAGDFVAAKLAAADNDEATCKALLDVAVLTPSPQAVRAVLNLATNDKALPQLRGVALQKLDVGLAVAWKPLITDSQLSDAL